jgi:hypothetical protein
MMTCEYDMVVELFADYPNWNHRIFQILTNLDILQGLEDCQETELRWLRNTFDFVVVDYLFTIEDVGACSAS